jgi:hypothetical protein
MITGYHVPTVEACVVASTTHYQIHVPARAYAITMLRLIFGGRVVRINLGEVIVCSSVCRPMLLILGIRIGESTSQGRG